MGGLKDVIDSDLLPLVKSAAPLLASVLGSPSAGIALSLLANIFDSSPNNIGHISTMIKNDADANVKLAALEDQHREALRTLVNDNYATEVDDRKNARLYGAQYAGFLKHFAYLVTLGFFVSLVLLYVFPTISGEEKNLLSMLIGMLASKWQTIVDFFFGSSRHNSQGATK